MNTYSNNDILDYNTIFTIRQQVQSLTQKLAAHVSQAGADGSMAALQQQPQQQQQQQQTYQPTQQQFFPPNAPSYWDAPINNVTLYKGKGGGKAKGKSRYGPPPADYAKPISGTCPGCNTDHNAESCWIFRNAFCRLPRPIPKSNLYATNQSWGGKGKGKGKDQQTTYNREAQQNTPAAQTLRD